MDVNRRTQIIVAAVVWLISLLGVASAARMHSKSPYLMVQDNGQSGTKSTGEEECEEPSAMVPQIREAAVTPPIPLPMPIGPPEPPVIGPPVGNSAPSTVLAPLPVDTVARSAPSAGLLRPMATVEPPLLETASARRPTREDNVGRPEPLQAAPPRPFSDPALALCLWSSAGGKAKSRTRVAAGMDVGPFVGTFQVTLDEHKSFILPHEAGEQMGLPRFVYATPGPDDCVWLCSAAALEKLTKALEPNARRLYYAQTSRVAVDRSGRIVLPDCLSFVACMGPDITLIGVGDHFELWYSQRLRRLVDPREEK
jgi:MraZ protein